MEENEKPNEAQRPGDGWGDQCHTSTREDEVPGLIGNKKVLDYGERSWHFRGGGEGWRWFHGRAVVPAEL